MEIHLTTRTVFFSGNRTLVLGSLEVPVPESLHLPFAALLPAYCETERLRAEAVVGKLVNLGCAEFSCVGPEAEKLHDAIDSIVEEMNALNVVTTWHGSSVDACEYFVFAAAGKPRLLRWSLHVPT